MPMQYRSSDLSWREVYLVFTYRLDASHSMGTHDLHLKCKAQYDSALIDTMSSDLHLVCEVADDP